MDAYWSIPVAHARPLSRHGSAGRRGDGPGEPTGRGGTSFAP
jgi:hypothetical protein